LGNFYYVLPKEDEDREGYGEKIIQNSCNRITVRNNAKQVVGCKTTELEYKFISLFDEGYKSFLLGLYHSTVSLYSVAIERFCYDLLENANIEIDDKVLDYEQKKSLFKIPLTTIINLLTELDLIDNNLASKMHKINQLRNNYVHPLLEGDPYNDAKKSINLLCDIIDSYMKTPGGTDNSWNQRKEGKKNQ
jgi:hypothetical protein